jgi:predicted  nucleic acid-binding Zn-ribbon protein
MEHAEFKNIHTYTHIYTHINTYKNLKKVVAAKFEMNNKKDLSGLDIELATHIKTTHNLEGAVDTLQEAITMACNKSFKTVETTQKWTNKKSVTWWTQELTIKRKRLNAIRRHYQRTHNNELRESRKMTYHEEKFTPAEVKNAIEDITNQKAPGEDEITGAIYKRV